MMSTEMNGNSAGDRRTTVQNTLTTLLDDLRKRKPFLENLEESENDDVCAFFVEGKLEEIKRLKGKIEEYYDKDYHFTREYRTLKGQCDKLLMDLDSVVVFGRDDLTKSTNMALQEVDNLIKALDKKVHANGKECPRCEIKDKV